MVIFTGSSVEEAQPVFKTLDIPRMRAHITVISREKKALGLFGKKPAQWMSS